jgi:hypothetical protein
MLDDEGAQGGQDPELAVSVERRARIGIAAQNSRSSPGGLIVGRKLQSIVIELHVRRQSPQGARRPARTAAAMVSSQRTKGAAIPTISAAIR